METIKTNVWKSALIAISLLAVFLLVLSVSQIKSIFEIGGDRQITNSITVSGKGEAISIPDIATLSFSITETAKTVADAQTKATEKQNAAKKALLDNGILEKDIKTQSYSINPHYEYQEGVCTTSYPSNCRPGKNVITGYDVSQSTEVKVRDLTKAGKILDLVGGLGVQNVNGLSFSIDKVDSVKEKARTDAIVDAKAKAAKLADELGVRLVRIVSFSDSDNSFYPMAYGMGGDVMTMKSSMAESAPRVAPDISTGEQKVTSVVSITYEIR